MPNSQRGISLIELMVSITIGLLILASLTTLFVNQSRTRAELDKSNRMIDNGRYAMDLLSEDLQHAGFYGQLDVTSVALPGSITGPCSTSTSDMRAMIRLHVVGYDAATPTSSLTAPPCSLTTTTLKPGSDVISLRRADTSDPIPQASGFDGIVYIQNSQCQFDTAQSFIIDNDLADFTLRPRNCTATSTTPYADLRRYQVHTYFIDRNNSANDGIPTLKRRELSSTGTSFVTMPLVEGIEFMQFEYGFDDPTQDTNGDGTVGLDGIADSYRTCADGTCSISDWSNMVAVKIFLVARNIESTQGQNDAKDYALGQAGTFRPAGNETQYKRHAYTQIVRLINPAGRRE